MFEDIFNGKNNLVVIHPGHISYRIEERLEEPNLQELQKLVAGYIELVADKTYTAVGAYQFYTIPVQIIVNEEGRLHGMPRNTLGTQIIRYLLPEWKQMLVGPVVILAGTGVQMT